MALVPSVYHGLIMANTGWTGSSFSRFSSGIANGVTSYLTGSPLNNIVTLGDVGAPGAGAGVGFLIGASCLPNVLNGLLTASLTGAGVKGQLVSQMSSGISRATSIYLNTGQTLTTHAGVGTGTTIGNFANLNPAHMAAMIAAMTGFKGQDWSSMYLAISTALVTFLLTNVKWQVVISGPAGPGTSSGVGSGRII